MFVDWFLTAVPRIESWVTSCEVIDNEVALKHIVVRTASYFPCQLPFHYCSTPITALLWPFPFARSLKWGLHLRSALDSFQN